MYASNSEITCIPYYCIKCLNFKKHSLYIFIPGLSDEILSFEPVEEKVNTSVNVLVLGNGEDGDGNTLQREKDSCEPITESSENEVEEEVELDNLFFEDSSTDNADVWKQEKSEKLSNDGYGHMLGNIDDIWKKAVFFYLSFLILFIVMNHCSL